MSISPKTLVELVLLGPAGDRRQLQDSPVLGDVWIAYGAKPGQPQDLLITPEWNFPAGPVAKRIARLLPESDNKGSKREDADVAYLHGLVAARIYFRDLLRVIIPMTVWWKDRDLKSVMEKYVDPSKAADLAETDKLENILAPILEWVHQFSRENANEHDREKATEKCLQHFARFPALHRYLALAGIILWAGTPSVQKRTAKKAGKQNGQKSPTGLERLGELKNAGKIVAVLIELFKTVINDLAQPAKPVEDDDDAEVEDPEAQCPQIYQVSLNRKAYPSLLKSVPAVKGDAARTVFSVKCDQIGWAVLDSGIDSRQPAFYKIDAQGEPLRLADNSPATRVVRTYDFSNIRKIVSLENRNKTKRETRINELLSAGGQFDRNAADIDFLRLARDAANDRPIDWATVEKYIGLKGQPEVTNGHGTHVAGIIGAAAWEKEAGGMCPDIQLYDFRVLSDTVRNTEFAIVAALQFIQYLNLRQSVMKIHGANLSLSIPHDVRNFACGQTPICVECNRLVDGGVVVVAAAGNMGYHSFETKDGFYDGYAAFSITDPGNADDVITVGATHRYWPHTYGVSFFSSRGPTGDGRIKPDIVAPGERIKSSLPNKQWGELDGTSMAAPHVSGAAAMLLARYTELRGQPRKIKKILCETATDLGRERTFQGHGMLDVLRAMQRI